MEFKQGKAGSAPAIQDEGWTPAACTLPTAQKPLRVAEFDALFAEAVTAVELVASGRVRMRMRPAPKLAGRAADLAARETECCSFFTFSITATSGELTLEVAAADEHAPVVAALAERAEQLVQRDGIKPEERFR
ncbi:hypothetical protein [Actinomadura terrae]|uniref:hypothetical protein n=1 Tax=Actinomadura terrae TaxID=604353 RepID=UPI001FA6AB47|nr:hypothetical protein [Actinomadura terrae]